MNFCTQKLLNWLSYSFQCKKVVKRMFPPKTKWKLQPSEGNWLIRFEIRQSLVGNNDPVLFEENYFEKRRQQRCFKFTRFRMKGIKRHIPVFQQDPHFASTRWPLSSGWSSWKTNWKLGPSSAGKWTRTSSKSNHDVWRNSISEELFDGIKRELSV